MNEIRSTQTKIGVSPFMKEVINQLHNLRRKPKATDIFLHIIELFLEEWSNYAMPKLCKKWEKLRKAKEANEAKEDLEI